MSGPIVVIGFDSADWTWIEPRMESGTMPHFKGLVDRGVRADLLSLIPRSKSPTIWTSIATGKLPEKHGVGGFVRAADGRVVKGAPKVTGSAQRIATTYWEILGAVGKTQAVIGWWVTYPATPVNGILVSDYIPYFAGGKPIDENAVYPPGARALVEKHRINGDDYTLEDLSRFINVDVAKQYGDEADVLVKQLKWIYAGDETYRRVAKELYADRPDVFTVYFRGVDSVSHVYWKFFQPIPEVKVKDWQVEVMKDLIPSYYDYADELLGEILSYVDPQSRILVCSDHGFAGLSVGQHGRISQGIQMHDDLGILIMAGPGVRTGATLDGADVKDITPTLLSLAGLPPAQDLDGVPVEGAFAPEEADYVRKLTAEAVDTYEGLVTRLAGSRDGSEEVDQEMLERLRALGYID